MLCGASHGLDGGWIPRHYQAGRSCSISQLSEGLKDTFKHNLNLDFNVQCPKNKTSPKSVTPNTLAVPALPCSRSPCISLIRTCAILTSAMAIHADGPDSPISKHLCLQQ